MRILFALFRFVCGFALGLLVAKIILFQDCFSILKLVKLSPRTTVNVNSTPQIITESSKKDQKIVVTEEQLKCKIPKFNPYDLSISHLVEHPSGIHCDHIQPYMTYIDDDGYLTLNETETNILYAANIGFNCSYQEFDRRFAYDEGIEFFEKKYLTAPILLDKDAVDVECIFLDQNETKFYHNVHAYPAKRKDVVFAEPTDDQLSVLFFVVDSVSHSAMQRNLPLTYNYTKNVMGMKFFNALNKISTNSFPNQMAWYTGKMMYGEEGMFSETLGGPWYKDRKFDSWPLIWKLFAAKSYATGYNQDWPDYGFFHYQAKGFTKKMFDYYYRWFWLRIGEVKSNSSSAYCFNNEILLKINLDIARRQMMTLQDTLQFFVNSITETTHSFDNTVEISDKYLLQFWKDVYEGGYLRKTVVFFVSDHGLRLGRIRGTYIGAMEDRLPFYALWFPDWFYNRYPHIKRNIDGNLDVLSSMFDVHETLVDIANANYDGRQRKRSSRGQSQLYPLPRDRTCRQAGIADRWCACNDETAIDPENNIYASEGASFLVYYINGMLEAHKDKCDNLTLSKIHFFRQVKLAGEKADAKTTHFFMGIETLPYDATYEVFLRLRMINETAGIWSIYTGLDRTSRYDTFSNCIDDWWLKHFCPCIVL